MKLSARVALTLILIVSALSISAQTSLQKLLTAEEWKASGLDRLSPAEIAIIEAALQRQQQPNDSNQSPVVSPAVALPAAHPAIEHGRARDVSQPPSPAPVIVTSPASQQTSGPAAKATPVATTNAALVAAPPPAPESTSEASRSWLNRFGLPDFKDTDWRKLPPLKAKVVSWETANRFILDNGQAWEGTDSIPDELVERSIEIHARPNNRFTLVLDGKNTKVRVVRVR